MPDQNNVSLGARRSRRLGHLINLLVVRVCPNAASRIAAKDISNHIFELAHHTEI